MIKALIKFIKREWPDILLLPVGIVIILLIYSVIIWGYQFAKEERPKKLIEIYENNRKSQTNHRSAKLN